MKLFIPNERHVEILNEIGRWKIIGLKDLFRELNWPHLFTSFCRVLRKLENEGLVSSFKGHYNNKYLSLSLEGGKYSKYSCSYSENQSELNHDILSSFVLKELLKFENFKSGHVVIGEGLVIPDALVHAKKNNQDYTLAIEVELHQKSKSRVCEKFFEYGESKDFDYVLYITNKRSIFDCYRNLLIEMNEKIQNKIILLVDCDLGQKSFKYLSSKPWFKKSEKAFLEIFK